MVVGLRIHYFTFTMKLLVNGFSDKVYPVSSKNSRLENKVVASTVLYYNH